MRTENGVQASTSFSADPQALLDKLEQGLEAGAKAVGQALSGLEALLSRPSALDKLVGQPQASPGAQVKLQAAATYQVRSGDTLTAIAAKNHTSVEALARLNNLADPDKIGVGQTLKLSAGATVKTQPQTGPTATVDSKPSAGSKPTSSGLSESGLQFLYDHEAQKGVSNHLHWPKAASGVTLGPGYDMKSRSHDQIVSDLTAIGVDKASAEKAAGGAGLSGADAKAFAANNKSLINLSESQEKQLLANTVKGYADHVRSAIKVPVSQNQFDAMVSFAYNIGTPGFDSSTALKRLNAGDKAGAAEAMSWWNKSDGAVNQGLVNRRADEVKLFNSASAPLAANDTGKTQSTKNTAAATPVSAKSAADYADIISSKGDAQAKADLAAGRKVVVALRTETDVYANNGKGVYDDKIAVVWKDKAGVAHAETFKGNTDPSGQYSSEGPKSYKGSSVDMNRDGKNDTGRLQAGSYRYQQQSTNFAGNTFFKTSAPQVAERDTNHDGKFDARDTNRIDTKGVGNSMYIHQGGNTNTGSAGCQTIASADFNKFVASLGGQKSFSYVLVNAN